MMVLATASVIVCDAAATLLVVLTAWVAVRAARSLPPHSRKPATLARLVLIPTVLGLAVRAATPWGPHICSGRDLNHIDQVIAGLHTAHVDLLNAFYFFLPALENPLPVLTWGQVLLGALGCGLVAVLTYELVSRPAPALIAGLLAACMPVLARVDSSPNAMVPMRLVLLLALIHACRYRRNRDLLSLVAAAAGLVAASYGRLDGVLLAGLGLVWMALDADRPHRPSSGRRPGLVLLAATLSLLMLGVLFSRWMLLPGVVAVLVVLGWRQRDRIAPAAVVVAGVCIAAVLMPRMIDMLAHERETASRFPVSFLYLFGRMHLLPFDPALVTPFALVFVIIGWARGRRSKPGLMGYLACVAVPAYCLYTLYMGDTSARLKLQGAGVLLLLPVAGLGAERILAWLQRRRPAWFAWTTLLALVVSLGSIGAGWHMLRAKSTLEQEYRFFLSLGRYLPAGARLYVPRSGFREGLLRIPRVIQRDQGFQAVPVGLDDPLPVEPGALVYLGTGCRRFHDGRELPGVGKNLVEFLLESDRWPRWHLLLKIAWNKHETFNQVFDSLEVGEWEVCARLRRGLALAPVETRQIERNRLECRWTPARYRFGLYRATRKPVRP